MKVLIKFLALVPVLGIAKEKVIYLKPSFYGKNGGEMRKISIGFILGNYPGLSCYSPICLKCGGLQAEVDLG